MQIVDTLKSRIRAKLTQNAAEHVASKPAEPSSFDIHDSMWAFGHEQAARRNVSDPAEQPAGMRI